MSLFFTGPPGSLLIDGPPCSTRLGTMDRVLGGRRPCIGLKAQNSGRCLWTRRLLWTMNGLSPWPKFVGPTREPFWTLCWSIPCPLWIGLKLVVLKSCAIFGWERGFPCPFASPLLHRDPLTEVSNKRSCVAPKVALKN